MKWAGLCSATRSKAHRSSEVGRCQRGRDSNLHFWTWHSEEVAVGSPAQTAPLPYSPTPLRRSSLPSPHPSRPRSWVTKAVARRLVEKRCSGDQQLSLWSVWPWSSAGELPARMVGPGLGSHRHLHLFSQSPLAPARPGVGTLREQACFPTGTGSSPQQQAASAPRIAVYKDLSGTLTLPSSFPGGDIGGPGSLEPED